jgi:hypothetical protein
VSGLQRRAWKNPPYLASRPFTPGLLAGRRTSSTTYSQSFSHWGVLKTSLWALSILMLMTYLFTHHHIETLEKHLLDR